MNIDHKLELAYLIQSSEDYGTCIKISEETKAWYNGSESVELKKKHSVSLHSDYGSKLIGQVLNE